jgi:transposase
MPKSLSIESKTILEKNADTSEVHRLIKLGLDNGLSINELASLAQVSRMTITNWIKGHEVRQKNIHALKEGLSEKGFLKPESKKRFLIPEIRNAIEQKKIADQQRINEEKEKNSAVRRIALEEKRASDHKNKILKAEYGREILEAAIRGDTGYYAYDHTQSILNLEEELLKRGFNVEYEDCFEIEELKEEFQAQFKRYLLDTQEKLEKINDKELNQLRIKIIEHLINIKVALQKSPKLMSSFPDCEVLNNLIPNDDIVIKSESALNLVELSLTISNLPMYVGHKEIDKINQDIQSLLEVAEPFEADDKVISKYYVSWTYPDDIYLTKDCINAKFIDWLSDLHGKKFISKIFSLIESYDLDNKSEITIVVNENRKTNEYTDDEHKKMLNIFDVDIPFPISTTKDMFNILGYETIFEKNKKKIDSSIGNLTIKWNL